MPLRQSIHRLSAEVRIVPRETVGLLGIHLTPLLQRSVAKVGREIHHPHTSLQKLRCELTGQSIGEAEDGVIRGRSDALSISGLNNGVIRKRQK